jgi:ABC-type protease/lipase transport system fused ATPase/permease subunit
MASLDTFLILAVFLAGAVAGALLLFLIRAATLDRVRQQFRAELREIIAQEAARAASDLHASQTSDASTSPARAPAEGMHATIGGAGNPGHRIA